MKNLIIFALAQLTYVILTTIKNLIVAKLDNKHLSALSNAIAYGFYTLVLKMVANMPLLITATITLIANNIGVYISYWIMEKFRKDDLWKVEIYTYNNDLEKIITDLEKHSLKFLEITHNLINVYCYTQTETQALKEILGNYKTKTNTIKVMQKLV